MTVVFISTFIAGLVLGVRAMLYGVERDAGATLQLAPDRIGRGHTPSAPRVRYWFPLTAAFFTAFGAAGYLTLRQTGSATRAIAFGLAAGAILAALTSRLVRRAAAFVPEHDPDDPRYVLQGHVARVTMSIDGSGAGEIVYAVNGGNHRAPARSLDGQPVETGTEVVIERIEEGVAYVEPWSQVEQRL